tara:strand:+ start:264 stop:410 length:147 start_codon:yes stop_codon:yes gene_type:complete
MFRLLYIALMSTWFALFVLVFTHTQVLADSHDVESDDKKERASQSCGG